MIQSSVSVQVLPILANLRHIRLEACLPDKARSTPASRLLEVAEDFVRQRVEGVPTDQRSGYGELRDFWSRWRRARPAIEFVFGFEPKDVPEAPEELQIA